ncbi:MAG: hypothetical protein DRK00_02125 [Thermoprotei archaeon]|nr:MAG: hypothetical protein DRK00_02125 [Thermoprotei archaeon]
MIVHWHGAAIATKTFFYTAIGHFTKTWSEDRFRKHLLGGILWAMRLE